MVEFAVAPCRMALVNVDIQNCFVEGSAPESAAVVARINALAAVCRGAGIPVIQVRHAVPAGADLGVLGEIAPIVKDGLLDRDSDTAAFHTDLVIDAGDILVEKPHFGAFHGTELEQLLRSRAIDTIIITGIETNVCCETTAREAMVRDFRVLFTSDGTTTGGVPGLSRDEVQRASLATLGMLFAQVITVDELVRQIQQAD